MLVENYLFQGLNFIFNFVNKSQLFPASRCDETIVY